MSYGLTVVLIAAAAAALLEILKGHTAWLDNKWAVRILVIAVCAVQAYIADGADGSITVEAFSVLFFLGLGGAEFSYQWLFKGLSKLAAR